MYNLSIWIYVENTVAKPQWPNSKQHCAQCTHGKFQTSTNACAHVSVAMLISIQSVGVAPEVNLRITQARKHAGDPPWV